MSSHGQETVVSFDELSQASSESESKKSSSNGGRSDDEARQILSKQESEDVFRLRVTVILVLFAAAMAVSASIFLMISTSEHQEFENQFEGIAERIVDAFEGIPQQRIGAVSSLAIAASAHGVDHHQHWPFVALSSFQERSTSIRNQAQALFVAIAPLISQTDRSEWESFVSSNASNWIDEGFLYQEQMGLSQFAPSGNASTIIAGAPLISSLNENGSYENSLGEGPFLPYWQTSPILEESLLNVDILNDQEKAESARTCLETRSAVIGRLESAPAASNDTESSFYTLFYSKLLSITEGEYVFEKKKDEPVAVIVATMHWASLFKNLLPTNIEGIHVVLENPCYGSFTYEIEGRNVNSIGNGDHHEVAFENTSKNASLLSVENTVDGTLNGLPLYEGECPFSISVYPTAKFRSNFITLTPLVVTLAVALIFVFTVFMFIMYDRFVERRQKIVLRKAVQTSAIVSSMFPKSVQDRLLEANEKARTQVSTGANSQMNSFFNGAERNNYDQHDPIADLFPNCTVLFADIAGFTAWSSSRDPAQVFVLLQAVYQAFDAIANRRKVFKVETIGDSYVAVAGLPEVQEKHAVVMARFAWECLIKMHQVTKDLEVSLGPDTGELSMRVGLHSGAVTAGVLRGDRARFQLFGDTVNTAARMESTGVRGKIQISQSTADLIIASGKAHWIKQRPDSVEAKGKGTLTTFWLQPRVKEGSSNCSSETEDASNPQFQYEIGDKPLRKSYALVAKQDRLIDWIVELLAEYARKIISRRGVLQTKPDRCFDLFYETPEGKTCLDEATGAVSLPQFDHEAGSKNADESVVHLDANFVQQLREYVSIIASTYRENAFHNFEHACHVAMSVNKLLKKIISAYWRPDEINGGSGGLALRLHEFTHGIYSDPLTLFGIVFSALIHDVDHRGVSNVQLIKEEREMAEVYRGKSVAEQNSLDISWGLLMSSQFKELRTCLFHNRDEMMRFRQVIVNTVLATDIFDRELNELRTKRWRMAFYESHPDTTFGNDLKATILIEHIIQASDVSHTMQHWHVYRKWNEHLFHETYLAYTEGRMASDPSTFWYEGELRFFDSYIIPLANKLRDIGVFGMSSDEYLIYALSNRQEWEQKGQETVAEMMKKYSSYRKR